MLHRTAKKANESTVLIDTIVQKNITYPTDAKLAVKIINCLNKLAKHHGIKQRINNKDQDTQHFTAANLKDRDAQSFICWVS